MSEEVIVVCEPSTIKQAVDGKKPRKQEYTDIVNSLIKITRKQENTDIVNSLCLSTTSKIEKNEMLKSKNT